MRKLTKDSFPHMVDCLIRRKREIWYSLVMQLVSRWWGVDLGRKCIFNGRSYFHRHPDSRILIGNGCVFYSSPNSNLIGVNRPCIISTLIDDAVIEIGNGCGFSGTVIGAAKKITLGKNVRCGANTLITDTDWHTDDHRTGKDTLVIINDGVWLGVNVVVLKGVTIGEGTLVAANSVVSKSLPSGVIAAGCPVKIIKQL